MQVPKGLLLNDDLEGLQIWVADRGSDWHIDDPCQSPWYEIETSRQHGGGGWDQFRDVIDAGTLLLWACFLGANRCIQWLVEDMGANVKALPLVGPATTTWELFLDQLMFSVRSTPPKARPLIDVLLLYGVSPNRHPSTRANHVSLLYRVAIIRGDATMALEMMMLGARLNPAVDDDQARVTNRSIAYQSLCHAERVMNKRIQNCRAVCTILLGLPRSRFGPRDLWRDLVWRLVWPTRTRRQWYHQLMPFPYQRPTLGDVDIVHHKGRFHFQEFEVYY